VDVDQAPPAWAEFPVEAPAKAFHLGSGIRPRREQSVLGRRPLIDPGEDVLGLAEHAVRSRQHRNRDPAPRAASGEPVDALNVALLPVVHSGPFEGPPRLLAIVADRNRDEPEHRVIITEGAGPRRGYPPPGCHRKTSAVRSRSSPAAAAESARTSLASSPARG